MVTDVQRIAETSENIHAKIAQWISAQQAFRALPSRDSPQTTALRNKITSLKGSTHADVRTLLLTTNTLKHKRQKWWDDGSEKRKKLVEKEDKEKLTKINAINVKIMEILDEVRERLAMFCRHVLNVSAEEMVPDSVEDAAEGGEEKIIVLEREEE
jgi:hypothetical protein